MYSSYKFWQKVYVKINLPRDLTRASAEMLLRGSVMRDECAAPRILEEGLPCLQESPPLSSPLLPHSLTPNTAAAASSIRSSLRPPECGLRLSRSHSASLITPQCQSHTLLLVITLCQSHTLFKTPEWQSHFFSNNSVVLIQKSLLSIWMPVTPFPYFPLPVTTSLHNMSVPVTPSLHIVSVSITA